MFRYLLAIIFTLILHCASYAQTFTNTTGGAIPDGLGVTGPISGGVVCFPVTVSGVGVINNANGLNRVTINIAHDYTADLNVRLRSPDGTIIPLALEDMGATEVNFTNTTFVMTATTAINALTADNPYTGNFIPRGNLGWFNNGQNANGVWSLCVEDIAAADAGSVLNYSIVFNNTPAPRPTVPGCGGNPSAGDQCSTSTPICNLNGYCGNTSAFYSPNYWNELAVAFDNCFGGASIENNSFIQFVASAATVNLNVNVSNSANGDGVQFFVFSGGCGSGAVTSHGCDLMTPGANTFTATGLTPGNTYYMMIDGFNGDVCDYTVTAVSGVNVLTITPASANICGGGTGVSLTASGGNGTYTWSPATGLSSTSGAIVTANPASTQTYTVTTGAIGSLNCPLTRTVTVTVNPPPVVTAPATVCVGNTVTLSPTSGGTWVSSNATIASVTNAGVVTGVAAGAATFTFTNTTTTCSATTATVIVTAATITPTFNAITPICSGAAAPVLPATSTNGITGTWSPATVSNTASGTYTFTPTPGQCANTATLNVTVTPATTPTFNAIAPICNGAAVPVLPLTSTNGITGTWSPAVSNTVSGTYTFTPDAGQCATTTTLNITVNPVLSPIITCGTSTATSVSFNWSAVTGATGYNISYTINGGTPVNVGPVGTPPYTVSGLTTGDNVTITVAPIGTGCFISSNATCIATPCVAQTVTLTSAATTTNQAACLNIPIINISYSVGGSATGATVTGLPPGVISNFALGIFTITGTPTSSNTYNYIVTTTGGCGTAATATGTIIVSNPIVPAFNAIAPICTGTAAPVLPAISTNGITGTWSPATVSNTTSATYTFTPNAGLCATTTTLNVTVTSGITPTFNTVPPVCTGGTAPVLPTTSTNSITGTWSPATVSNTTSATYIFTPNAGQCATTTTLNITVTPLVTPTFNPITPFCEGTTAPTLPSTSNNGINGVWLPAVISNTTSAPYAFTPLPGQCASPTIVPVIVIPRPTVNLGNDTLVCNSTALILDAASIIPFTSYVWSTGATSATITVTTPGTYSVTVTNPLGCSNTDAIDVDFGTSPVFSIGRDTGICPGQTIVLNSGITDPGWSILWQDGSTNPTFNVTQPGTYFADVINTCGTTRRQVNIIRGLCKILMPTAFSPNDDGRNDIYKAGGGENVTKFNMKIFSRWGQLIFESNNVAIGWNGRFDGVRQNTGAYIYKVTYTDGQTNKVVDLKGTLMLLR